MKMAFVLFLVFVGIFSAFGSEPGSPLSWDDWVIVVPGFWVEPWLPFLEQTQCENQNPPDIRCFGAAGTGLEPNGTIYFSRSIVTALDCPQHERFRYEVWRINLAGYSELLAYLDERCQTTPNSHRDGLNTKPSVGLDQANGFLIITTKPKCEGTDCSYTLGVEVFRIRGTLTLFEILQTYEPPTGILSFRVPYMPEGLGGADWFDTYWGEVTKPLYLSTAQPLQCHFPEAAPKTGDYLEITAGVPRPAPGRANYVLTAVNYQGERRAGRKAENGRLSGRDASVLPECPVGESRGDGH